MYKFRLESSVVSADWHLNLIEKSVRALTERDITCVCAVYIFGKVVKRGERACTLGPSIFNQSHANGQANARWRQQRHQKRFGHHADCEKSAICIQCARSQFCLLTSHRQKMAGWLTFGPRLPKRWIWNLILVGNDIRSTWLTWLNIEK